MKLLRPTGIAWMLVASASGCSLKAPSDSSRIYLDLSELTRRGVDSTRDLAREFGFGGGPIALAVPTGWGDFQCYGVNVVGPGIPDSSTNPGNDVPAQIYGDMLTGKSCAYRGVVSSPVAAGTPNGNVELQVPTGPGRIVQVIGSVDSAMCASGFQDGASGPDASLYEIGRTQIDLYGDRSLSIPVSTASLSGKEVDCDEGGCATLVSYSGIGASDVVSIANPTLGFMVEFASATRVDHFTVRLESTGSPITFTPSLETNAVSPDRPSGTAVSIPGLAITTVTVGSVSDYTFDFTTSGSDGAMFPSGKTWVKLTSVTSDDVVVHGQSGAGPYTFKYDYGGWTTGSVQDAKMSFVGCN